MLYITCCCRRKRCHKIGGKGRVDHRIAKRMVLKKCWMEWRWGRWNFFEGAEIEENYLLNREWPAGIWWLGYLILVLSQRVRTETCEKTGLEEKGSRQGRNKWDKSGWNIEIVKVIEAGCVRLQHSGWKLWQEVSWRNEVHNWVTIPDNSYCHDSKELWRDVCQLIFGLY